MPSTSTHYTLNPCTGTTTDDQVWQKCDLACPAGQYVSRDCTPSNPTECSLCKERCPDGYYMQGSCDGTTKYDTVRCVKCKDCADGQYKISATPCNWSTTFDPVVCRDCSTSCRDGQYVFGACGGLADYDETSCKQCTVCDRDLPNQYNNIYGSCNGMQKEDAVVCSLNVYDNAYLGNECPAGFFTQGSLNTIDNKFRRMAGETL
jgi:hypothetical protein